MRTRTGTEPYSKGLEKIVLVILMLAAVVLGSALTVSAATPEDVPAIHWPIQARLIPSVEQTTDAQTLTGLIRGTDTENTTSAALPLPARMALQRGTEFTDEELADMKETAQSAAVPSSASAEPMVTQQAGAANAAPNAVAVPNADTNAPHLPALSPQLLPSILHSITYLLTHSDGIEIGIHVRITPIRIHIITDHLEIWTTPVPPLELSLGFTDRPIRLALSAAGIALNALKQFTIATTQVVSAVLAIGRVFAADLVTTPAAMASASIELLTHIFSPLIIRTAILSAAVLTVGLAAVKIFAVPLAGSAASMLLTGLAAFLTLTRPHTALLAADAVLTLVIAILVVRISALPLSAVITTLMTAAPYTAALLILCFRYSVKNNPKKKPSQPNEFESSEWKWLLFFLVHKTSEQCLIWGSFRLVKALNSVLNEIVLVVRPVDPAADSLLVLPRNRLVQRDEDNVLLGQLSVISLLFYLSDLYPLNFGVEDPELVTGLQSGYGARR